MSSSDSVICPACGARNAPGAAHCELCGTPFDPAVGVEASGAEASGADRTPSEPPAESPPGPAAAAEGPASGVYCNQCGWKNPPGARFCSQCGARLQEVPAAAPRPAAPV
ncbi:MAG: zinc-ribbon domain-containing protein, partial [Bacteroidetes bacterium]